MGQQQIGGQPAKPVVPPAGQNLHYTVEWRLITAGSAHVFYGNGEGGLRNATLELESAGLVSKLFRIKDTYKLLFGNDGCAHDSFFHAEEGRKQRETTISYTGGKTHYVERDLTKNREIVSQKELDVPACVYDPLSGLVRLRSLRLEPGQNATIPITDGKKFAQARIEAQEREEVKTPLGKFKTVRYEAFLFNNVIYSRSGHLYVWLTDDERHIPVQIQVKLRFHIGTITLMLTKEENR